VTDFHVVPEALRLQAVEIKNCADHYYSAANEIGAQRMGSRALGIFGDDITRMFNDVLTDVEDKLRAGQRTIKSAGDGLDICATHYEQVDNDYYRKFGYIDDELGY
jgi:hypothetical protein